MPERNPHVTIKPPNGENKPKTELRFRPIFVSMNPAMKIVVVDKIADIKSGINDTLSSRNIIE